MDDQLFRTVVCGVDASSAGLDAVRQVVRLAGAAREVVLVAVCESHLAVHAGMHATQVAAELEAEATGALEQAAALAGSAETLLVRGRAADGLLRIVRDRMATLVAVGSHGVGRGAGAVLGSVASRMVHDAPCSVLVARPRLDPQSFPRSIVVGLDGSAPSLHAAAVGQALGERLGATVTFVTATGGGRAGVDEEGLAASGVVASASGVKPMPALLGASNQTDLLIVGARGVRGLRALGSVSERVAHRAACSVLVVRSTRDG